MARSDLKGEHISTGSPGSATEVMAFRILEAAGLDKDKDVKRERLGVAESVNAIKENNIDAFFWVGGLPTAAVTDLAITPGTKIRMVDHSDVMNLLVAHANMDDKTAYNIVKTIFDKRADLIAVHKEAENFKLENQRTTATPIPFHPGAVKYFAEKGVKLSAFEWMSCRT